ncbi:MAG: hypothetical protein JO126_06675 [Alphaproteobacteria bacterium]|nr:hypothetical protein [Alphaproteobacteria bacterium]MBV8549123.1 hypothetical protein [Alphaproteobacteria bacterium]
MTQTDSTRWQQPIDATGTTRMDILRKRHVIKKAVRAYLDQQGFTEIDSPLLVRGTTPDIAVESFQVGDRYLATSTEYQMKRLAVGGFKRIYSLTQNFRLGDTGTAFRNPEFTMLEWGRVGERMAQIEQDLENMLTAAMQALGITDQLTYQGRSIDMRAPWPRRSVAEVMQQASGITVKEFDSPTLLAVAQALNIELRQDWLRDGDFLFSLIMDTIQPTLGTDKPIFIIEWPIAQTASAEMDADTNRAVRSELFVGGVELADGFAGLADASMQEQLFAYMQAKRAANKQQAVQIDTRYLQAVREANITGAGMAMGFDRLVMLLTNQSEIRNTLAFGWDEV